MKIGVVGTGYVGLVSGACLAKMGNSVICIDVDEKKIQDLKNSQIPIYEPGLAEIVSECIENNSLLFSTDIKDALSHADVLFIAVGTPMGSDGQADLKYVLQVAKSIGENITHPMIIVDKSTVPVGTGEKVNEIICQEIQKRNLDIKFEVVSNPEFLKEGAAVDDFLKPDRVVVGSSTAWGDSVMRELYAPFMKNHDRFISMDVKSAEMTKYAANSMLATKISFINEIANICEKVGADVNLVRKGIGSDSRIGYSFIYPGCGYGGSCFPKDVEALIYTARQNGFEPELLNAVESRNKAQKRVLFDKIYAFFDGNLSGKKIALWGLAFKPNTDDMREASSITLIELLEKEGAVVSAYDPKAVDEAKKYLKNSKITYTKNKYDALDNAECMVLLTEWSEFRSPDFYEIKNRLKNPVIFDGRNQYNLKTLQDIGFKYFQIGVKA
ncbi:UDP-glucose 6-dehydrogenase [Campylobacter pinnipediorum subsp. pinnipediorum]|uniref:UDP-glucose 6-dehydrogenase n=1 Tax=Campylobacter pinnipediorum subsp. pinnipediorum TaxID=1660067 RepID=A0AAX0L9W8_9BACT|nr:UDP-glucose/GDP-mannose dehydrogenase family protein [Campylobacter pinnipediorum]AQW84445.1 UDP-glucose 6-dehydrogenase [Campylobacter pinnipediorum subsp. pinnipediorum]OPA77929.1 UDP-glucose 6-dehydrogenase [Campylobacter pinnipediorum subsp. pinnipediorum]